MAGIVPSGFASMKCKVWEVTLESVFIMLQHLKKKKYKYVNRKDVFSPRGTEWDGGKEERRAAILWSF